ncbi:MAG TPA: winged helix-turn-helix domain-containing protein [Stellaceae bacterium]|nr:winged helix-turn-helix domain-containing protein [Stellaceae bacterium]
MNYAQRILKVAEPIRLADESDFTIGPLSVRPSALEVQAGETRKTIEPRVMQVLVVLARVRGNVVSRDDLVELCWGGRIVGDDAINTSVAKVRALAGLAGEPAFRIDAVPRVGYRLTVLRSEPVVASVTEEIPEAQPPASAAVPAPLPVHQAGRRRPLGKVLTALLAAGAVIGIGVWALPSPSTPRWSVVRTEVPISSSLINRNPAISPNGDLIAWSAGKDFRTRKIYLEHIAGNGAPLRLTEGDDDDGSPTWSPDGSQIAYVNYKEGRPCRLMITGVPAGPARELGSCRTDERSHVVWSPSGRELYLLDRADLRSPERIMRFDLATGRSTPVTKPPDGSLDEDEPAVSPDGHWLTFLREISDSVQHRIVLDLRTGAEQVLYSRNDTWEAAWSEDSKTIFVDKHGNSDFALLAWPIDGHEPDRILSGPQPMLRLSAGPHGLLAVEITNSSSTLMRVPATPDGAPVPLAPERGWDGAPDIAPDGTIATISERPGGVGIWLLKNGQVHELIGLGRKETWESEPRWSPDGSRIAFVAPVAGAPGIKVVTAAGADAAVIPFNGLSIRTPAWSADGTALVFPGRDASGWRLWRVELARPDTPQPMSETGWLYVRSRGDALYGVRDDQPGVWRIDGSPRKITPRPEPDHPLRWAIAGDEIAYVEGAFGPDTRILAQKIEGGPPRVMTRVPSYDGDEGFAVDPESGNVIYPAVLNLECDIELLHLARR